MLKRFSVENFSSFMELSTLDLTAGKIDRHDSHLFDFDNVKILKSAIIYGANASGKSNFIKAIDFARQVIIDGLDKVDTFKKFFRLVKSKEVSPSSFEFELELNNIFYSYGFSSILSTGKIAEEWLYQIGTTTPKLIFERTDNEITLGSKLKNNQRFNIYKDDMKNQSSQLFLSEIGKKELDGKEIPESLPLNQIFQWFIDSLLILYPDTTFLGKSAIKRDKNLSKVFKDYLSSFDTGVVDISEIEEDFEKNLKHLPTKIKKEIEKDLSNSGVKIAFPDPNGHLFTIFRNDSGEIKILKLGLVHGLDYQEVFELKDESDGTIRLLDLIPLLTKTSENKTIFIDEFDRSLHPKLTKEFFSLFYKLNKHKSQLIVTTHESTLLDLDLLRQDEIWFTEKNKIGASRLFSLNEFKVRYDKKIEKAYLLGRYGAVPLFKTFENLELEN